MARKSTSKNAEVRLSLSELVAATCVNRKTDEGPWRRLRGWVWISYVMQKKSWSWNDLAVALGENRTRSNLVQKWRLGQSSPYPLFARKIAADVPGSLELFELPLWLLLKNRPRTVKYCRDAVSDYLRSTSGFAPYRFDGELSGIDSHHDLPPMLRTDSDTLVKRGDIYALTAIVALVREMEASYKDEDHERHIANMYRVLPSIGKISYMEPHLALLCEAIQLIHARVVRSLFMVGVNWDIIGQQMLSDDYEPVRELRPRDPLTYRFQEIADPIIHGEIRPAWSVGSPGVPWKRGHDDAKSIDSAVQLNDQTVDNTDDRQNDGEVSAVALEFFQVVANDWCIDRADWERILGIGTQRLNEWLAEPESRVPQIVLLRVWALWKSHNLLAQMGMTRSDLRQQVNEPVKELEDKSAIQMLCAGHSIKVWQFLSKMNAGG